jgi:KaiC/GvpD/RAD55 family RecA-like ATPase
VTEAPVGRVVASFPANNRGHSGNGSAPDGDESKSPPPRRMQLEWFDQACALALSDTSNPLIAGLLDENAMSVIYGESNSGKTFVALDMAFSVATGLPWNGKETKRGLIVYVAAEGGKRIMRRLAALKKRHQEIYGPNALSPLFALIRFPIDLRTSDANLKELLALIREAKRVCGEECAWIIIDTLSRALAGGDENSSVDMGRVVVSADRIRSETGAHFTYVHHTGKDGARGARGHSLLRAATDTEIEVASGTIKVTKQRDLEGGAEFGFGLVDLFIGEDASGRPVKSAVVELKEPAKTTAAPCAKSVPASQRLFLEVVTQAIEDVGEDFRSFANGPLVRAVSDEIIRERYYARIAEKPKDGDTPLRLAERQRKTFNLAIKKNLDAKRLVAGERNGGRVIWLA